VSDCGAASFGLRATCRRFPTGRHVGPWESSDMSEHSANGAPLALATAWKLPSVTARAVMSSRLRLKTSPPYKTGKPSLWMS
jgi:hypothetical protein